MIKINSCDLDSYKKIVVFDTNFLFSKFQFNLDIFNLIKEEIGFFTPLIFEGVILEIEKIKGKNSKYKKNVFEFLEKENFKIIESSENYVDKDIITYCKKINFVATNDKKLRKEIKGFCKTIFIRQKKFIEIG